MTAAYGTGIATLTADDTVLDVWYPEFGLGEAPASPLDLSHLEGADDTAADRGVRREVVHTVIADTDTAPTDAADAYLRLHLISGRVVRPHGVNLDGVFGKLSNVVWTNFGPCAVEGFEATRAKLSRHGRVTVYSVDKFPRMVDYVVPTGVRIGDADRVRLGAHLAEGTTVMHEGFVNFNAGTLGSSMVEGRISGGVVVGGGSDVGGGASIMGTLSGGGKEVISVGEALPARRECRCRCLPRRRLCVGSRSATSPSAPRSSSTARSPCRRCRRAMLSERPTSPVSPTCSSAVTR